MEDVVESVLEVSGVICIRRVPLYHLTQVVVSRGEAITLSGILLTSVLSISRGECAFHSEGVGLEVFPHPGVPLIEGLGVKADPLYVVVVVEKGQA